MDPVIAARMRADWDQRAREDAHYYVAFGRRDQDPAEFFETGAATAGNIALELKRLPAAQPRARRALEIGCGPGRLLRPMSKYFGEIHGIDVSPEMIDRARANLRDIPHAHVHTGTGADLCQFADASFDFIYSYAVFQHIPSRDVIFSYLDDAARVLKPGGVIRVQASGLPPSPRHPDTWQGATLSVADLRNYAAAHGLQLFEITGARTQYLWGTFRKPLIATGNTTAGPLTRIRRITCANSSEPAAPVSGPFAAASLWIENLPADADLLSLEVRFHGLPGEVSYIGPPMADGLVQVNVFLPAGLRTGLAPVQVLRAGKALGTPGVLRLLPPPPMVPRVVSVQDGVNLLEENRIVTGCVKVTLEEVANLEGFTATLGGEPVEQIETFLVNPLPPRWEVNFHTAASLPAGDHLLHMSVHRRHLTPVAIRVEPLH